MSSNKVRLGDLIEVLTDYHANGAYKKLKENVELLDDEDYALMVRTTNFENNDFNDSVKYINEHAYNFLEKSKVYPNDLIMNKIANAGSIYLMPDLQRPVSLAMNLFLIRINEKLANPVYVYLYLKINEQYVKQFANGSVTKTITKEAVRNLEIFIPSRAEQDAIVQQYIALDNKIKLNLKINQTLESIAQVIFKSWFVDFDPVRAKIAARQEGNDPELAAMYAISGKSEVELEQMAKDDFAELQATAALFPDELVESELGEVPREWKVGCIGDEVNTVSKTYPLKQVKEVVFLNTGDILKGKFLHANKSSTEGLPGQAKKSIQKDDILYSEIRPQNKRFAYVHFDAENYVVSTKLMVLRQKSKVPSHFVYFILSQQSTIDFLQVMAESRSGTFPQITFDVLSKVEYLKPNNDALIDIFTRKVLTPFFEKKVIYETENNKLLGIRDIVLPKLLSGQLDLSRLASEAEYESSTE